MVRACVRGWKKYLEDPDATNARIHELNREMDLDILAFGVEQLRPLVLGEPPQPEGLGRMTLARWETLVEQLVECDQLKPGEVDPRQAFTTQFLPK
jgi:NitT/TauT family transport system substrate-binding protein